jgi:signal peptidase I
VSILGLALIAAAAVAATGVWWLRRTLAVVTVSGASMRPTLRPGDRVLVRRVAPGALRRWQVVVVEAPPYDARPIWLRAAHGRRRWLIKRVAALPGEVPGEPAGTVAAAPAGPASPPAGSPVPAGSLFVLGDNPAVSGDSRTLGYLPLDRVLGVVVKRM